RGLASALFALGQPRLDHQVIQLVPIDTGEVWDPHQHRGIAVEVRRREVHDATVGEEELLHVEVGDAEHQDVVEALTRLRIDRVSSLAAMEAEHLPVYE